MLVLCQKLQICTYDQQKIFRDPYVPKVEMLEPPLHVILKNKYNIYFNKKNKVSNVVHMEYSN